MNFNTSVRRKQSLSAFWQRVMTWLGVGLSGIAPLTSCVAQAHADDKAHTSALAELNTSWTAQPGYTLSVLAQGLDLPTSLAAIPEPAPSDDAPALFITELRGKIKTRSRTGMLTEFARVVTFTPRVDWPNGEGEAGLAGICLSPEHGYVFVTYAYRDRDGIMRNGITRFSADPTTFSGPARDRVELSTAFAAAPSAFSHQIGTCQVHGELLYVSVGDAGTPGASSVKETPVGKVLRLSLDGAPAPGNPFAQDPSPIAQRVFALGLRNPFGLVFMGDKLYASENGTELDRFLEIVGGRDYHWDGTDASIATNALAVFSPTIGPVQTVYVPPGTGPLAPSDDDRFLISASDGHQGPGLIELSLREGVVARAPRHLVRYEGTLEGQGVTGVAVAKEGIFFTPILPVGGQGVVLSIRYAPGAPQARAIGSVMAGGDPIAASGCLGCHSLGGVGAAVGPALDANSLNTRIQTRVLSQDYARQLTKLDSLSDERAVKGRDARREVLNARPEDRVNIWIANRLLYPQFDNLDAQMPAQNLDRRKADMLAARLVGGGTSEAPSVLDVVRSKQFLAGGLAGCLGMIGIGALLTLIRKRPRPSS